MHLMINPNKIMKNIQGFLWMLAFLPAFLSCKDKIEEIYTVNEPVYLTYTELRGDLKVADGREIIQPGKIYFKDDYIFVNEYQKGIHVIDNSNPSDPQIIKFIEIPGNVDMAIKDNIMYADSYVDLVAIDISNIDNITEVKRIENVFPYMVPECANGVIENVDQNVGVVVAWKATEKRISVDDVENRYTYYPLYDRGFLFLAESNSADSKSNTTSSGTGGSMARFTVYEDFLYAVNSYMLRIFDITQANNPSLSDEMYVGWNIETLFPYGDKLFMGSTQGMYIYNLANPAAPEFITMFRHASSCDPVVVENNKAYVTLRAGNLCGDSQSQLDVIDISDISNPVMLKAYDMEEPYGLGIDDNILFVCDGDAGLKIYNASDPYAIDSHQLAHYADINAWDVIPLGDKLIMIGTDGLYQYDYSDPADIQQLSLIPIESLRHSYTD
jgi:hypothetical protein